MIKPAELQTDASDEAGFPVSGPKRYEITIRAEVRIRDVHLTWTSRPVIEGKELKGRDLDELAERLREFAFLGKLRDDPEFIRMMDQAEDPDAGIGWEEFENRNPDLS